jgi:hypothetical protein
MFQLPFGGFIPAFNVESQFTETVKFESKILCEAFQNGRPQEISDSNMELLVLMKWYASRDLLDAMDYMMQTVRKKTTPFGGVQVLFIGDLLQLPQFGMKSGEPCAYYKNSFHSHVVQQNPPIY